MPEEPYVAMLKVLDAAEIRPSGATTSSPLPSTNGVPTINLIDPTSTSTPLSTEGGQRSQGEDGGEGEDVESPAVAGPIIDESVDWGAVDEEVDAFLNETDDDDMDDAGVGESGSGYVSDSSVKSGVSKYVHQPITLFSQTD